MATSVPSAGCPCVSGVPRPRASCSMAGPGKAPLKLATSSHLRIFASPRSILRTILTVGSEGEGMERRGAGQTGRSGPGVIIAWLWAVPRAASPLLLVKTRVPSVQGPTKDSGQRRQPPLVVPQPRWEQQLLHASRDAVNWVLWKRLATAAFRVSQPGAWIPAVTARQKPSH